MKEINLLILKNKLSKNEAIKVKEFMYDLDRVLGILKEEKEKEIEGEIKRLIDEREEMRKKKEWKKADEIRERLLKMGIQILDTPNGPVWKFIES